MPVIQIDDVDDERLREYLGVSDPELATREGLFVAEGRLVVRRLLETTRFTVRSVLVTEAALSALSDVLPKRQEAPVFVVPQVLMNGITGFNIHRGCLAIGERPTPLRWQQLVGDAHVIVVLERVANADNVGGVFRNVAAFGAAGVLLDPLTTDPLYRKAIRTSMGAALQVPFARAEPWPDALLELRRHGFTVIAMTPHATARPLRDVVQMIAHRPAAIVLGHEGEGLSQSALDACEYHARIPITGDVDSLNVATAAGIALYELARS